MRSRRWFIRFHKKNKTREDIEYIYNVSDIYNQLCGKYDTVVYITHNLDEEDEHYHFIIQNKNAIRFEALKKLIPYGDIEEQKGSNQQVIDYMLHLDENSIKEGKLKYMFSDLKYNIENFELWLSLEFGKGKRNDVKVFASKVLAGSNDFELLEESPDLYARYGSMISRVRENVMKEKASEDRSTLEINYFYGDSGTGKTFTALHSHDRENIYRVTDYKYPFDNYQGQEVIIFDEFRDSFNITSMLTYLDHYAYTILPARYNNKYALYKYVYIISNVSPFEQYTQYDERSQKAFLRRITNIIEFTDNDLIYWSKAGKILEILPNPKNMID